MPPCGHETESVGVEETEPVSITVGFIVIEGVVIAGLMVTRSVARKLSFTLAELYTVNKTSTTPGELVAQDVNVDVVFALIPLSPVLSIYTPVIGGFDAPTV